MNEISRTADEGALERCEGCGELVLTVMMMPVMVADTEVVTCLGCHVDNGRMFI